ncbi:MAG TPA: DUF748 domain-containing protein [Polyangia bacterium]|nr:DUF748 domain-containing protein [Polyangia bacterium]
MRSVHHRGWWIALGVVIALVLAIRLVLDPIAAHYTRKELNAPDTTRGDFDRVHVTVLPPGYEIHRLKIDERVDRGWKHPLFYAERVKASADLRSLLHGHLAAHARIDEPKFIYTERAKAEETEKKTSGPPDLEPILRQILPARVDRIEVRDGEVEFRDLVDKGQPKLWVHDIELAVENLATRRQLSGGEPATVSGSAKLGRSGQLSLFVSANPFARPLVFAGRAELRGWRIAEMYDLVEPQTKLQPTQGTLDVFVEFKSRDGRITGGVKPVLKNAEVKAAAGGIGTRLKAWVADEGLHIFSDRVPGRNAVATVVPIEGRLDKPDVQLWPTVMGVIRNAFVEGVSAGFRNVPPEQAEKKEGKVQEVEHAVEKSAGPPKAQPAQSKGK